MKLLNAHSLHPLISAFALLFSSSCLYSLSCWPTSPFDSEYSGFINSQGSYFFSFSLQDHELSADREKLFFISMSPAPSTVSSINHGEGCWMNDLETGDGGGGCGLSHSCKWSFCSFLVPPTHQSSMSLSFPIIFLSQPYFFLYYIATSLLPLFCTFPMHKL